MVREISWWVTENLNRAVVNARKQRDSALSPITVQYWVEMLQEAERRIALGLRGHAKMTKLVRELEDELAASVPDRDVSSLAVLQARQN